MYKIIIILFLIVNLYCSEQYIISYRGVVKANKIYSEKFNISRAMKKQKEINTIPLITLEYSKKISIKKLLEQNQDILTQELFKQGILLNDTMNKNSYNIDVKTVITLPPTYITVSINEDFASIRLIK